MDFSPQRRAYPTRALSAPACELAAKLRWARQVGRLQAAVDCADDDNEDEHVEKQQIIQRWIPVEVRTVRVDDGLNKLLASSLRRSELARLRAFRCPEFREIKSSSSPRRVLTNNNNGNAAAFSFSSFSNNGRSPLLPHQSASASRLAAVFPLRAIPSPFHSKSRPPIVLQGNGASSSSEISPASVSSLRMKAYESCMQQGSRYNQHTVTTTTASVSSSLSVTPEKQQNQQQQQRDGVVTSLSLQSDDYYGGILSFEVQKKQQPSQQQQQPTPAKQLTTLKTTTVNPEAFEHMQASHRLELERIRRDHEERDKKLSADLESLKKRNEELTTENGKLRSSCIDAENSLMVCRQQLSFERRKGEDTVRVATELEAERDKLREELDASKRMEQRFRTALHDARESLRQKRAVEEELKIAKRLCHTLKEHLSSSSSSSTATASATAAAVVVHPDDMMLMSQGPSVLPTRSSASSAIFERLATAESDLRIERENHEETKDKMNVKLAQLASDLVRARRREKELAEALASSRAETDLLRDQASSDRIQALTAAVADAKKLAQTPTPSKQKQSSLSSSSSSPAGAAAASPGGKKANATSTTGVRKKDGKK